MMTETTLKFQYDEAEWPIVTTVKWGPSNMKSVHGAAFIVRQHADGRRIVSSTLLLATADDLEQALRRIIRDALAELPTEVLP